MAVFSQLLAFLDDSYKANRLLSHGGHFKSQERESFVFARQASH